jgi:hypothetical protein
MENTSEVTEKKGMGPLGWLGIGCGGILLAVILGVVIFWMKFGGEFRQMADEAKKNPARAGALAFVKMGKGSFEMQAEDEAGKRYTVREIATGKLTTFYWSAKSNSIEIVEGDFSAIPSENSGAKPESKPEIKPESTPVSAPKAE